MAPVIPDRTERQIPVSATNLLINNRWIPSESGKRFETVTFSMGEEICQTVESDVPDKDEAVRVARKTFDRRRAGASKLITICSAMLTLTFLARGDTTFTIGTTIADAFLASGSPANPVGTDLTGLNFGGAGTLAIAPASSTKGEFDSVIRFNTAAAISQFDTIYGIGNWEITSLTLSLASNFGVQGVQPNNGIFNTINTGLFGIDWLGDNNWVEGTGGGMGAPGFPTNSSVSFNSIPMLFSAGSASLGTYTYTPPGNNVYVSYSLPLVSNLVSDAAAGGDVSLYFFAADNQVSYLFNSRSFSANHPELTLTVTAVPEPSALALMATALGFLLIKLPIYQRLRPWVKRCNLAD
jgi:hypothetical protein